MSGPEESKILQPHAQSSEQQQDIPHYYEEISFIDLAITLVNHSKLIIISFILFLGPASIWILSNDDAYKVISIFEIGTHGGSKLMLIENPKSIIQKLEEKLIPEALLLHQESESIYNLGVEVSNSAGTSLIILTSTTPDIAYDTNKEFHNALLSSILDQHKTKLDKLKTSLEERTKFVKANLGQNHKVELSDRLYETYLRILVEKANIEPSKIISLAQKREKPDRPKAMMLALAFVTALMFSTFLGFVAEFLSKVKYSLNESPR